MMNDNLKVSIFDSGKYKIVRVNEDIHVHNANSFRNIMTEILEKTESLVLIDLNGISIIDSAGFGALLVLQKQTPGRRLGLANVNEEIKKVLSLTSLNHLFNFYTGSRDKSYHQE
jgi:anti-anti-sigma factor